MNRVNGRIAVRDADLYHRAMIRNVVFAAPFPLETTMRFARAAARLPGVRLLGVLQESPKGEDARIFSDVVRVSDGLSTPDLVEA